MKRKYLLKTKKKTKVNEIKKKFLKTLKINYS